MNPQRNSQWPVRRTVVVCVAAFILLTAFSLLSQGRLDATQQTEKSAGTPAAAAAVQQDDEENALQKFMRQKLVASTNVLEGLVTDELTMVSDGADVLLKMGREEKWRASNDMIYHRYSVEFEQAVKEMKDEAEAQSIEGTSLAWINVTMKCLKCHEWVRNTIIADDSSSQKRTERTDAVIRALSQATSDSVPQSSPE
ncbi:MAG: hypothetical protein KDA96_07575 [Planctomycetaceae bacterium]|nr:hypothetical protein [Planctomycetaceae bacterium]